MDKAVTAEVEAEMVSRFARHVYESTPYLEKRKGSLWSRGSSSGCSGWAYTAP